MHICFNYIYCVFILNETKHKRCHLKLKLHFSVIKNIVIMINTIELDNLKAINQKHQAIYSDGKSSFVAFFTEQNTSNKLTCILL